MPISRITECVLAVAACTLASTSATLGGEATRGSIVGWGSQVVGTDLSADFVAVAAGGFHNLGVRAEGPFSWNREG